MFRILFITILLFLLFLAFTFTSQYDASLKINLLGYHIETTLFVFAAVFLLLQFFLLILFRSVALIVDIPNSIKKSWFERKLNKINKSIMSSLAEIIMDNKLAALTLVKRIYEEIDEDMKDYANLVMAESETSFDIKIKHLRNLIDKKFFNRYACKKLANIFFANSHYVEAEKYGIKAFNDNEHDIAVLEMLIRTYAKLKEWQKMIVFITKLQRSNKKNIDIMSEEISEYYYLAAKSSLEDGADSDAIRLLESSLEFKMDNVQSLGLFVELNINMHNRESVVKIIKAAFANSPCFEIAEMYIKAANLSAEITYANLVKIADIQKHYVLFLSLAAYLNLEEHIAEIRKSHFIDHYGEDE